MMLTGAWFGLVIGFGVWRWGSRSWGASMMVFAMTWAAWELAVNLALQLEQNWLKATALPGAATLYVAGFAAGAVGAFVTWAGAAVFSPVPRLASVPIAVISAGAVLGLLLPYTHHYDNPAVLLLPWQIAIAAILGIGLGFPPAAIATSTHSRVRTN